MTRIKTFLSLLLIVLLAITTSNLIGVTGSAAVIPTTRAPLTSGETWQIKWNNVVEQARKEGTVVVYGSAGGKIRDQLVRAFNSKYRIPVDYLAIKGPEIATRILTERRSGLYLPDVIIGASGPSISVLKPAGVFDPLEPVLILPEVINPTLWWQNRLPWVDKDHNFIAFLAYVSNNIVINSNLIKPGEVKSYNDILDPRWKGKMVMFDPTISGPGKVFTDVVANDMMGVEYLRKLAGQEPFISRDERLLTEWLGRGKYPLGVALDSGAVGEMISAGVPLQFVVPTEGTYVETGTGFISRPKNAPHPNASTVFINWLLSKDGQTVYTDAARVQSARIDIPTTNIDIFCIRKQGVKYVDTTTEEFYLRTDETLALAKQIFGRLIK